jgi:protein-tyrosine phosphatase
MLVDIHTHILPGIDDGPDTYGEAIVMLRQAVESGIKKMVATPHFIKETDSEKGRLLKPEYIYSSINALLRYVREEGLDIDILPGSEVYFYPALGRDLDDGIITTINNSRYLLIEFPSRYIPENYINVFYDLYHLGYKPIICHPERNLEIMEDPNILYDFITSDWALAQVNSSSLLGIYGSRVKKTAELFVKNQLVQLIASDCHSIGKRKPSLKEGLEVIDNLNGCANYFIENNHKVIENQKIEVMSPKKSISIFHRFLKQALSI